MTATPELQHPNAEVDPAPWPPPRLGRPRPRPRPRSGWLILACAAVLALAASVLVATLGFGVLRGSDAKRDYLGANGWPTEGQAAYRIGSATVVGPGQRSVPIASLAKVMTARLVLRDLPLRANANGPTFVVSAREVADTRRRRALDQSLVPVRLGERLTERQALLALLLPSANNVAAMLAQRVAGSQSRFVASMNAEARALGMTHTRYTDPSGFDQRTVSTAADQAVLAAAMARDATFVQLAGTGSARLPVAGTVHNTDTLLGTDAFIGTKTGSHDAAGGCFMFTTYRVVRNQIVPMTGVVLGQRGHDLVTAALTASRQLADRVAPAPQG